MADNTTERPTVGSVAGRGVSSAPAPEPQDLQASASSAQPGRFWHDPMANNSALSFSSAIPTTEGSQTNLLHDRSIEMPPSPSTPEPSHQRAGQNHGECFQCAVHAQEGHPPNGEARTALNGLWPNAQTLEEWKSWKIRYPWLSFLLGITLSIIGTIASLNIVSKRNNGFAPLRSAPAFLARDPELERAIWTQGILYTAFPAFIMTLYRTMWEATVASFADRQPYVDLKKEGGRPAKSTIMLDYKTEPVLWAFRLAFQNGHYILGACMLSSVVLTLLVVPIVAFLFTTASFASYRSVALSTLTTFTMDDLFLNIPDLRLSLDSAAALRVQNASRPPWTDGEYALPKFAPLARLGDGNITVETTAYSAHSDCVYLPESQYEKTTTVFPPGSFPGVRSEITRIEITANDRGCQISDRFDITTKSGTIGVALPQNYLKAWYTFPCSPSNGWSRTSILTARFVDSSTGITNFSLISCIPSYRMTLGTMVASTRASSEPSFQTFTPHSSNMTKFRPGALWYLLEKELLDFNCFDATRNVNSYEFGRHVYRIAAQRFPVSPMLPAAIIDATQTLFSTTFAVLASTTLFQPVVSPVANVTGVYSAQESRLIVVSTVAYIILSVLVIVALLNITLFFYARYESILLEEPVGLVSAAGILHNSDVNGMVQELVEVRGFDGRVTHAIKKEDKLMTDRYCFDDREGRIIRYKNAGTPRKSWWKWMAEWARDTMIPTNLINRYRRR